MIQIRSVAPIFAVLLVHHASASGFPENLNPQNNSDILYACTATTVLNLSTIKAILVRHKSTQTGPHSYIAHYITEDNAGIKKITPFISSYIQHSRNYRQTFKCNRDYNFAPCVSTDQQSDCRKSNTLGYQNTVIENKPWERGHLVPFNAFRFDNDALSSTNGCVNLVPQNPGGNGGQWRSVEKIVFEKYRTKPSYVLTGISASPTTTVTEGGYYVPNHFWKLLCYKNSNNQVLVHGYDLDNKYSQGSDLPLRRRVNQKTVVDEHLRGLTSQYYELLKQAWSKSEALMKFEIPAAEQANLPTSAECISSMQSVIPPEPTVESSDVNVCGSDCYDEECYLCSDQCNVIYK